MHGTGSLLPLAFHAVSQRLTQTVVYLTRGGVALEANDRRGAALIYDHMQCQHAIFSTEEPKKIGHMG